MPVIEFNQAAWIAMAEALLIGLIVGVEREGDQREERHAGLRDFVTIGLAGGLCGLMGEVWLTVAVLLALAALLIVFRIHTPGRTGITTEIAAVVTFLLCVLTATTSITWGSPLAIALTVVLALFLDARIALRRFFVEKITENEFHDTLRFLAVIFVILPVLPDGGYGPYEFLNPRRVWMFVILVCSINWLGYFFQKFLGAQHGLRLTAIAGGIASTTAATSAFAKECADAPHRAAEFSRATLLANAVQFPRIYAILLAASPALAAASALPLAAMGVSGLLVSMVNMSGSRQEGSPHTPVRLGNPFRLGPALKFGALFAAVRLVARALGTEFGEGGALGASVIGGSIDVDAIAFSLSGLVRDQHVALSTATAGVFLALAANAVLKTFLAYSGGCARFGHRVLGGFMVMFGAGAVTLALVYAR